MSSYGNPADNSIYRPAAGRPRTFDANVQSIASAAHARGVALMHRDQVVGTVEGGAAELCRTLRQVHEATRRDAQRHGHVEQLAAGIAAKLGAKGAVQVSRTAWNLLQGYAKPARGRRARA